MTRTMRLLASASLLAVAAFAASPASAAGTAAGATITNTVTVDYKVGGVSQNQLSASDSFTVDRKINLTVAEVGSTTTSVSPGQTAAVTAFSVTNASNASLDFALAVTQPSGGTAAHGGTDNFNVGNIKLYVDTNSNGSYDAGDTQITYLDQIAADASVTVFVVADVPLGRSRNTASSPSERPRRRARARWGRPSPRRAAPIRRAWTPSLPTPRRAETSPAMAPPSPMTIIPCSRRL